MTDTLIHSVVKDALKERNIGGAKAQTILSSALTQLVCRENRITTPNGGPVANWLDDQLSSVAGVPRDVYDGMSARAKFTLAGREHALRTG